MTTENLLNVNLSGKTALVCGASTGIGEACARVLASQGARVIALSRTEATLKKVVESLPGHGHRLLALDLNDHTDVRAKIPAEVATAGGAIEILVNNSAGPKGGPILDATSEQFMQAFTQHLLSAQLLSQMLVPGMKERGYGRIVNIISTSVRAPIAGLGVSNTIRAAVASWAKTLSQELGPYGITVNSVLPGYTNTPRLAELLKAGAQRAGKSESALADEWKHSVPMRRFAEPLEVASAVGFLASQAAGYINGVALPVDGGRLPTV